MCIGDVHGRDFWKDAIEKHGQKCDKIIFLGDYVDPYQDENITRKQAIRTLEEVIEFKLNNRDKTVLLLGNHCAHYLFKGFTRSTRYDSSNAYKIRELYCQHRSLFHIAHEEMINDKKYLFTHAGVMKSWYERNKNTIGELTTDNLNRLTDIKNGISALSDISRYRTWLGEKTGSPLWSDVREKIDIDVSNEHKILPNEDSVIDGYDYQIFGHTQLHKEPIINDKWACLDCRQAFIIDEENNIIAIGEKEPKAN